jgi:hypothetical protein
MKNLSESITPTQKHSSREELREELREARQQQDLSAMIYCQI